MSSVRLAVVVCTYNRSASLVETLRSIYDCGYTGDAVVDVLVVAVGHSQYRALTPEDLRSLCRGQRPILADVKSLYDRHAAAAAGLTVFRL